jgi:lipid A 3-O-deacylase
MALMALRLYVQRHQRRRQELVMILAKGEPSMNGSDLWYPREECRCPREPRALGRGVALCWLALGLVALIVMWAGPAHADPGWIDEVKLGVLAHDIRVFGLGRPGETGADLNIEALFPSPALFRLIGAPRPHLGVSINTAGQTNYGYFGLTWSGRPWRSLLALPEGLFVAGSFGGAAHDGYLNNAPPGRKRLGSRLLFRESAEFGYQLTRRVSVSVLFDHLSNAGLAHYNQSLNNLGIRVGLTF